MSENRDSRAYPPAGLQRKSAAAFCGVGVKAFDEHVRPYVQPAYVGSMRIWLTKDLEAFLASRQGPKVA